MMTKRNKNQSSPRKGENLDTEFSQEVASGDNNKGNDYNSKRGSKSQLKNPSNH